MPAIEVTAARRPAALRRARPLLTLLIAPVLALAQGVPAFTEVTPPLDPLWVTDAEHDFWLNAAAPADVDGDGDLDLAVIGFFVEYNVSAEDRLVVFLNDGPDADGNWTFTTRDLDLGDQFSGASDLAWGDFDGDGDPDLAVASEGATEIFRNDAGALFRIATDLPGYREDSGYTGAYDLRSVTWADADNDADLDLLIPSVFDFQTFSFKTVLMRNDGSDGAGGWRFVDAGAVLDDSVHAQTAWADEDGDGDLDLFMANVDNLFGDSYVRTYRNEGDGQFTMREPIGAVRVQYGLGDWADYDGDGDLDILVVGLIQDVDGTFRTVLRLYVNENGSYVVNSLVESDFFPWLDLYAATWADYDSDGDVDILLTGTTIGDSQIEGRSEVYVNEGGEFVALGGELPAPIGSVGRGGSFTWFDIDGDGDLDYFVAGAYYVPGGNGLVEAQMHLYRNDAVAQNAEPGVPAGLSAEVSGDGVQLSWLAAPDDTTPTAALTYDLQVVPSVEAATLLANQRRLPEPGNISAVTRWSLEGLAPGSYTWSVRGVDSAFNGGPAAEGTFSIEAVGVSGTLAGARVPNAVCTNVTAALTSIAPVQAGAYDCTAAGMPAQSGDRLRIVLRGRGAAGVIAGDVSGMRLARGVCRNLTTGQALLAEISGAGWSCNPLPVTPGDDVRVVLVGAR